jgi:hypothetical protein
MRLLVGHQDFNIPNGYNSHCDWLKFDGIYEKLSEIAKDEFEVVDVNVNECNDFYIFPVNALWAKFELFEEETFFGNYLSKKVIEDLQSNKCLLHINWSVHEAYRFDKYHMNRLYEFLIKNGISPKNILISSNNFQFKRDFDNWNDNKDKINILELEQVGVECYTHYLGFKVIDENNAFDNKLRHSHFLSLARAGHQHRVDLVDFYEKEGYGDDKILWSALWKNKRIDERFHWPNIHKESGLNHGDDEINLNDYKQNPYLHSYVEIVTETIYGTGAIQISDKPLKPIINLQPFIYVTSSGGLKVLKDMGYKTFEPFIDESYDDIEDETERLNFIKSEIKRLIKLKKSEIHNTYYQIVDVLRYDRKHWLNVGRYRVIKQMEVFYQNIRN